MTQPKCLHCGCPLSPAFCFDGLCHLCAGKVIGACLFLRELKLSERVIFADMFRIAGAPFLAEFVEGSVAAPYERLMQ